MGKETGVGGPRGEEKEEGDGKVGGRGGRLRPEDEAVKEGEVDRMHQLLRSSLAAASIPSGKGSFFVSPQNNHQYQNDHHQLSVEEQNQRAPSSLTHSRDLSRTTPPSEPLTASSFKQKPMEEKMPGGDTVCPPIQFAVSSAAQLARPVAVHARFSHHVIQAEGQDAGSLPHGGGRPTASLPPASSVVHLGSRPPGSVVENPTVHVKGSAQHSQSRSTVHRFASRSSSAGVLQHSNEGMGEQGQSVPMGQALPSAISHSRKYSGISHPEVSQGLSPQRIQTQGLHQQQAASCTITSQQLVSSAGRPSVSGSNMASNIDSLRRDRSAYNSILVKVCDRKVRLSSDQDPTSLYALCRRWVRNDVPRIDQAWEQPPLPRPLIVAESEKAESQAMENGTKREDSTLPDEVELTKPVESVSEKELLQHHVEHFKNIRKRCREDRMRRVAGFKQRLALLLPANSENSRRDSLSDPSHHPRRAY